VNWLYLVLIALAALFFYADIFFLGVACAAAVPLLFFIESNARNKRRRAAAFSAARARAAQAAAEEDEDEDEYDPDEYEEEKILIRNKVGKIPSTMHLRIRPKSKRRSSWEMTAQDLGDVMDTVVGSVFRLVSGKHEAEGRKPWESGRGR